NHVVGQWVRDTAGPALEARRARVRAIEAAELPGDSSPFTAPAAASATTSAPYVRAAPDEITRAETPMTVATRADRVQRPALAVAAAMAVALLGGLWLRGSNREPRVETPIVQAPAARPVV